MKLLKLNWLKETYCTMHFLCGQPFHIQNIIHFNFLMCTAYYAGLDENYKLFSVLEVIMLSMSVHRNRNVIRYN